MYISFAMALVSVSETVWEEVAVAPLLIAMAGTSEKELGHERATPLESAVGTKLTALGPGTMVAVALPISLRSNFLDSPSTVIKRLGSVALCARASFNCPTQLLLARSCALAAASFGIPTKSKRTSGPSGTS